MSAEARWAGWALAVVVAGWLVFGAGLDGGLLDWDDGVWAQDPIVGAPVGEAVRIAFTTPRDGVYPPLLRLSWWAQLALFGDAPWWALHAVDLALYVVSALGLAVLLRRLGVGAVTIGVGLGLWFVHPTKVECVCWLTAHKDVLSLALLVGMGLALVAGGAERPGTARIAAGTALGVAALLVKAAVFPVVWLLAGIVAVQLPRDRARAEVLRRFGAVGVASVALIAVGGRVWEPHPLPDMPRLVLAAWVHGAFWLRLVPSPPAAIVAIPEHPALIGVLGGASTVGWAIAAATRPEPVRGRWLALLAVWVLPQVPFLGVASMLFWASDRHLLVASLGPALAVGYGVEWAWRLDRSGGGRLPLRVAALLVALVALSSAWIAARRVPAWHDSVALWESDVARADQHWARWHKVGVARGRVGRFADAEAAFDRALALNPTDGDTLAHRLVATLAADGDWSAQDRALVAVIEPPPADDAGWERVIAALRAAGREDLAAFVAEHRAIH